MDQGVWVGWVGGWGPWVAMAGLGWAVWPSALCGLCSAAVQRHGRLASFLHLLQDCCGTGVIHAKAPAMRLFTHPMLSCCCCLLAPPQDVDLFAKDFIFVPVHEALHWSLMVVCHPGGCTAGWTHPGGSLDWPACGAAHRRNPCMYFWPGVG